MTKNAKFTTRLILFLFLICSIYSCQKSKYNLPDIASLTIVNGVVGGVPVKMFPQNNSISVNNSAKLAVFSGNNEVYVFPVGDSTNPYCSNIKYHANSRYAYSLFVGGQKPNTQCKLVQDNIPLFNISDSLFGVRFINLSTNITRCNVTISTTTGVNEVSNLGFMDVTDFKQYSARNANVSYVFQFRNASDNSIVTSYTFSPVPVFSNVTLALGVATNGSPTVIRISNDR
jgi:hypothetical protein